MEEPSQRFDETLMATDNSYRATSAEPPGISAPITDAFMSDAVTLARCSICVLTHNRCAQLIEALAKLRKEFSGDDIKIIVLNNGSTDDTANFLDRTTKEWSQLIVIHSKENLGCARGREMAWNNAKSELVLSMDDDSIIC